MASHLILTERGVLYRLLKRGIPKAKIAELLGRDRSTIYRELARNTGDRGYRPKQAQRLADERRQRCRRSRKMSNPRMNQYVIRGLQQYWSPDQISGRARRDFPKQPGRQISHQTIYNWIAQQRSEGRDWRKYLRRGGQQLGPSKRGRLVGCVTIEGRPRIVDQRRRFGDWEGDTIVGKGALLTAVERKSGLVRVMKMPNRRADTTARAARQALGSLPRRLLHTITFDHGKEFAQHETIAQQLGLEVYFAQPYCAWQRGTNENTNGLLRQYFPKGTDFTRVSHQAVARMEQQVNERPRRRLRYRTPIEVLGNRLRCV